jgi:hypothetical protein
MFVPVLHKIIADTQNEILFFSKLNKIETMGYFKFFSCEKNIEYGLLYVVNWLYIMFVADLC